MTMRVVPIGIAILSLAACMGAPGRFPSESPGCLAIVVSQEWADVRTEGTPIGGPIPAVIRSLGSEVADSATAMTIDGRSAVTPTHLPPGLSLRLAVQLRDPGVGRTWVHEYFARDPIGPLTTDLELLKDGGVRFVQGSGTGHDAESVIDAVGPRALPVQVGPFEGALVHADPIDEFDTRPYNLYWSDKTTDYMIEGNAPADAVVQMAQSLYCS